MNILSFSIPNLSLFAFEKNITINRQNVKISIWPTSNAGFLTLNEKYIYLALIYNILKAQPSAHCRIASQAVRRWQYLLIGRCCSCRPHFKNWLTFEHLDQFASYLEGSWTRVSRFAAYAYVMIRPTQPAQPAYQLKSEKRA